MVILKRGRGDIREYRAELVDIRHSVLNDECRIALSIWSDSCRWMTETLSDEPMVEMLMSEKERFVLKDVSVDGVADDGFTTSSRPHHTPPSNLKFSGYSSGYAV